MEDLEDLPLVSGGDPLDALGHQRALAAHLADHLAAMDGVDPEGGGVHRRRCRLEASERQGADGESGDAGTAPDEAAAADLLSAFGTGDIHGYAVA